MENINDPTRCQEECQKNVRCNFWTLNKKQKKCWLKPNDPKAPTPLKENPNCIRGPKTCTKDKLNNVNNCGTGILN